ncbi:MAG: iron ABC transporter permease [Pseudomonadota bacterium]|nr:iron ABC transporter permease [Pseudomonadota bacterium]
MSGNRGRPLILPILGLILLLAALLSLATGVVAVAPGEMLSALLGRLGFASPSPLEPVQAMVVSEIRLPRTLLSIVVGAGLAVSGAVMQGLFRNPLADPGLLGVSAGAALGAVSVIVLSGSIAPRLSMLPSQAVLPLAAFAGSLAATLLVYRLGRLGGRTDVATMLLAGIAINAIAVAGTSLLTYLADDQQLRGLVFWSMGSVGDAGWDSLLPGALLMLAGSSVAFFHAPALNAILLGEAEAAHLGFEVDRIKRILILLVALIVGAAVSLSGIIGFVGLVVPHLLRLVIGPDHRLLLPASALGGAILLLCADLLARSLIAPAELPIGILTALLGGPFFLWLLLRWRRTFLTT